MHMQSIPGSPFPSPQSLGTRLYLMCAHIQIVHCGIRVRKATIKVNPYHGTNMHLIYLQSLCGIYQSKPLNTDNPIYNALALPNCLMTTLIHTFYIFVLPPLLCYLYPPAIDHIQQQTAVRNSWSDQATRSHGLWIDKRSRQTRPYPCMHVYCLLYKILPLIRKPNITLDTS